MAWIIIPNLFLSRVLASGYLPITSFEVYGLGAVIVGLQVLAILTDGSGPSPLFAAGTYVVELYYIYEGSGGGYVNIVNGVTVELYFPVLVFLLMLYPLVSIVRLGLTYLLSQNDGSRPIPDDVRG